MRALVLFPLALAAILAVRTLPRDSCTVDEFGNLPLAIAYWTPGALHVDPGNPPLTRWIQGIPFLSGPPDLGASRADLAGIDTSWDLGYRFERAHPDDYHALLVRARWASLALLLAVVFVVFGWAVRARRSLGRARRGDAHRVLPELDRTRAAGDAGHRRDCGDRRSGLGGA